MQADAPEAGFVHGVPTHGARDTRRQRRRRPREVRRHAHAVPRVRGMERHDDVQLGPEPHHEEHAAGGGWHAAGDWLVCSGGVGRVSIGPIFDSEFRARATPKNFKKNYTQHPRN